MGAGAGVRVAALAATGCVACVVGGGPFVGVGSRHGALAGVEAGGGLQFPLEGTIGYQTTANRIYARADAVIDGTPSDQPQRGTNPSSGGARVGAGIAVAPGAERDASLAAAAGLLLGWRLGDDVPCGDWVGAITVGLEVRYAAEWQLVLASRYQYGEHACLGH